MIVRANMFFKLEQGTRLALTQGFTARIDCIF